MTPWITKSRALSEAADECKLHNSVGIGALREATSAIVTETRNENYILELDYPTSGTMFSELQLGAVIAAKANQINGIQPFRIEQIRYSTNGTAHVTARHIILVDLSHAWTVEITATSGQNAIGQLSGNVFGTTSVVFSSSGMGDDGYTTTIGTDYGTPRDSLTDITDAYGGELLFDGKNVTLYKNRGTDRGARVIYGSNMTDGTFTWSMGDAYSMITPYCKPLHGKNTLLTGKSIQTGLTDPPFDKYIKAADVSEYIDTSSGVDPTTAEIEAAGAMWVKQHPGVGHVSMSCKVSFIPSLQAEKIGLCDTVLVQHTGLGISVSSIVTKTVWNVLQDKYDSVEIGTPMPTVAKTIDKIKTKQIVYAPVAGVITAR